MAAQVRVLVGPPTFLNFLRLSMRLDQRIFIIHSPVVRPINSLIVSNTHEYTHMPDQTDPDQYGAYISLGFYAAISELNARHL